MINYGLLAIPLIAILVIGGVTVFSLYIHFIQKSMKM